MSVYLVAVNEPDNATHLKAMLEDRWPGNHYFVTEQLAFVSPDAPIVVDQICEAIGMDPEGQITGLVAKVDYDFMDGWNSRGLWEWVDQRK